MSDLLDVVKGVATVALTVYGLRWLTTAKGSDTPRIHGEVAVYGIRWQIRAIAYAAAAIFLVLAFVDLRGEFARGRWVMNLLFAALALGAAWLGTGTVTSDSKAISKKSLWHTSSLEWEEISEVRFHKRDGGAVELRGSGRKLIVDSRFVAAAHLRRDIEQRTKLQPLSD
jgi:hypothetical protein